MYFLSFFLFNAHTYNVSKHVCSYPRTATNSRYISNIPTNYEINILLAKNSKINIFITFHVFVLEDNNTLPACASRYVYIRNIPSTILFTFHSSAARSLTFHSETRHTAVDTRAELYNIKLLTRDTLRDYSPCLYE